MLLGSSQGAAPAINTVAPVISGSTAVLSAVTGDTGTWTGTTGSARFRHKRDGVIIPGETASTYYRATADISHSLTREVGFMGLDGVLVWAASNALTDTVEATQTVSKTTTESPGTAPDASSVALIASNPRWKSSGGTRVITYSFPSSIDCYGDISFQGAFDGGTGTRVYSSSAPWYYNFVVSGSPTVTLGDVYTHNSNTYTVVSLSSGVLVAWSRNTSPLPTSSGTLTKSSPAQAGSSATITFTSQTGFSQLTATEQTSVRNRLAALETIADIHFREITEAIGSDPQACIRFLNTADYFGIASFSNGEVPGRSNGSTYSGGDVTMSKASFNTTMLPGSLIQYGLLHELGHTMGFDHAHSASPAMDVTLDHISYTIMSYRSYQGASSGAPGNSNGTYPNTYMGVDIRALKYLYGANPRWKPAGVTYKFLPTGEWFIDGVSQGTPAGSKLLMTVIESSNGNDTYDFSAFTTGTVTTNVGDGLWMTLPGLLPDMGGGTHPAPGCIFFEYGLNPANKTIIPAAA